DLLRLGLEGDSPAGRSWSPGLGQGEGRGAYHRDPGTQRRAAPGELQWPCTGLATFHGAPPFVRAFVLQWRRASPRDLGVESLEDAPEGGDKCAVSLTTKQDANRLAPQRVHDEGPGIATGGEGPFTPENLGHPGVQDGVFSHGVDLNVGGNVG